MIEHCVWIKFNTDFPSTDRKALFERLAKLVGLIPGLLDLRYGPNAGYEPLDQGFRDGFIAIFEDATALARYQSHPDHQSVSQLLVANAQNGLQGILVFDLETAKGFEPTRIN